MAGTRIVRISRRWLGKDFLAINLFGIIFAVAPLDKYDINHERIHSAQQRELLYVPFFVWYVCEWLVLWARYRDRTKAYFNIRFEKEAYRHQHDLAYLSRRRHYCYAQ